MTVQMIYITAETRDKALALARTLVDERLIACANVVDGACSVYRWGGRIQEENEAILFAKTTSDKVSEVVNKVKELHDYSCPCIVSYEARGGNSAYLDWVEGEVSGREG